MATLIGVAVFLHLRPGVPPATGGTDGTVVNHVGFLVPNVHEQLLENILRRRVVQVRD